MNQTKNFSMMKFIIKVLQGALIGLGAVLPGISGIGAAVWGVVADMFGTPGNMIPGYRAVYVGI